MRRRWTTLPRDTRLLLAARAARSVGQGALIVAFALYLDALGWSAPAIGALFTAGLLIDTALIVALGPASDRLGRRVFLLAYEAAPAAAAVTACARPRRPHSRSPPWWAASGAAPTAAAPFAPIELSWLSQALPRRERGRVYSLNMAIGFSGMGIGALLGAGPALLGELLPGPLAYRPLFALVLAGSLVCLVLIALARDAPAAAPQATTARTAADAEADRATRRSENALMRWLFGVNALNGIAIGLVGPLMTYWFAVRFGRGPADIGPVMALAYGVTAVSSLFAGRLVTGRRGPSGGLDAQSGRDPARAAAGAELMAAALHVVRSASTVAPPPGRR